jgi:DNA-binding NarL/FixJ family response regulator
MVGRGARSFLLERIRILLGEIPQELSDGFKQAMANQPDMELVGEVKSGVEILLAVGQSCADVVVLGLQCGTLPGISSHLLAEYPRLKILAVTENGRGALLNELHSRVIPLEDVSPWGLLAVIRAVVVGDETYQRNVLQDR